MKFIIPTVLLCMQAASSLAAPFTEGTSTLVARQDDDGNTINLYRSPDGNGNITLEWGNGKLNYGERLPSTVLDIIRDKCGDSSCMPGADYSFTSFVVEDGRGADQGFYLEVQGSFGAEDESGNKNELLELAKLAFQEAYNSGVATHTTDAWYVTGECPPSQVNGCLTQGGETTEQWESVDHVFVRIGEKHMNIAVYPTEGSAGEGVCEALSAAAAGMALANAAAGFVGGILSIGCTLVKDNV